MFVLSTAFTSLTLNTHQTAAEVRLRTLIVFHTHHVHTPQPRQNVRDAGGVET